MSGGGEVEQLMTGDVMVIKFVVWNSSRTGRELRLFQLFLKFCSEGVSRANCS